MRCCVYNVLVLFYVNGGDKISIKPMGLEQA